MQARIDMPPWLRVATMAAAVPDESRASSRFRSEAEPHAPLNRARQGANA